MKDARVEYDVKAETEEIIQKLGIPVSTVIGSPYCQIIYQHSVPCEPLTIDTISNTKLNTKLQNSYEQSFNGEGRPYAEVFDELERN